MKFCLTAATAFFLAACATSNAPAQTPRATGDLNFFLGHWEGEGAFLRPFDAGAAPIPETVRASCEYVLAEAYIQCATTWTRTNGRQRSVLMFWNFNDVSGAYEGLFLASNYGQEASYPIRWDEAEGAFVGETTTSMPDGRPATERAVYRVSADRRVLNVDEFVRPNDTPDAAWARTYAYVWRRAD